MSELLTAATFEPYIGQDFAVENVGVEYAIALESIGTFAVSAREGGGFALNFRGPSDPMLNQATYSLRSGDSRWDIFLVPIGVDSGGARYEAVFN